MLPEWREDVSNYPGDCRWVVMEGKRGNAALFVRLNIDAKTLAAHPEYKYRVGVAIPLISKNGLGLPDDEETEQLNAIEDALNIALCVDQASLQVLVITTGGMREFIYYTRDPNVCASAFSEVERAIVPHELQAYIAEDVNWSVYGQYSKNAA